VRSSRRAPKPSGVDLTNYRIDAPNDSRPLSMRDTLPAPPSQPAGAAESGARRIPSGSLVHRDTVTGLAPPSAPPVAPSAPPVSASPSSGVGRYSAQPMHDDVVLPPVSASPKRAAKDTIRSRPERNALRVDDVGATKIVARQDASVTTKPRLVTRARTAARGLDAADRSVLLLLDRPRTVPELVHASMIPEHELMKVIARFVRLGLVSCSS
jgi:hypothetical protein